MSEYIRDPRFLVHGAAIKIGKAPAKWYSRDEVKSALVTLDWRALGLLAHNTQFDGFILSEIYNIIPGLYLDTLAMSRGALGHSTRHTLKNVGLLLGIGTKDLGALENTKGKTELSAEEESRLAAYSRNDAELCSLAFWKLYPSLPDEELELIHKTVRMFCEPVLLTDKPLLEKLIEQEQTKKSDLLVQTNLERGDLLSAEKFAAALRFAGLSDEELPVKISPTTGQSIYAFAKSDEAFKELQKHPNEKVKLLAQARLAIKSTIHETRAGRILINSATGPLPVALNYAGAHTFRWSGGNKINLQNLPKGSGLRRSILAPPGHVLCVADSGQIEARITAWLAKEDSLLEAFARGDDVYSLFAARVYNKPLDQITKEERFIGKTCVLGLGFGMSGAKLKTTLASGALGPPMYISLEDAQKYVSIYRASYPRIVRLWRTMGSVLKRMYISTTVSDLSLELPGHMFVGPKWVKLPNLLILRYPGLEYAGALGLINEREDQFMYQTTSGFSKIYGGLLTENIVQALARVFIGECMINIDPKYRVVTMTHDEIVTIAPQEKAETALKYMFDVMTTPPRWAPDLPLKVEGGYDVCYSK